MLQTISLQKTVMRETQRRRLLYDVRDKQVSSISATALGLLQARFKSLKRELYRSRFNKRLLKRTGGVYTFAKQDDWDGWENDWEVELSKSLMTSAQDLTTVESNYFASRNYNIVPFDPMKTVDNYQTRIGRKLKGTAKDTLTYTQQTITSWYHTDESLPQLIDMLEPYYGEVRATLIAETEVAGISSQVSYEQMVAYNINQWKWDAFMDAYTCPLCQDLNGQIFDREDNDSYPPDSSHPRCRCGILYVVDSPGGIYYGV